MQWDACELQWLVSIVKPLVTVRPTPSVTGRRGMGVYLFAAVDGAPHASGLPNKAVPANSGRMQWPSRLAWYIPRLAFLPRL